MNTLVNPNFREMSNEELLSHFVFQSEKLHSPDAEFFAWIKSEQITQAARDLLIESLEDVWPKLITELENKRVVTNFTKFSGSDVTLDS